MNFVEGTISSDEGRSFVVGDGAFTLPLPSSIASAMQGHSRVVLGIRPENVGVGDRGGPSVGVPARVDLVEPLGNETFVHAAIGAHVVTVRYTSRDLPTAGETLMLRLDPARAHWFDTQNGERLGL